MNKKVLIVIPAYNEALSISNVILRLRDVAPNFARVIVNDGSSDDTSRVLTALGEKEIRHSKNLGYGRAIQTGIKYALAQGYDVIVTFDADGQHRAQDVEGVVAALLENDLDLVIGSRYINGQPYTGPLERRIGQITFSVLTRVFMGKRIYDTSSGFKAIKAGAAQEIIQGSFMDYHIETLMRLSLLDYRIAEHPVIVRERHFGDSMHSAISLIIYPLKTMLHVFVTLLDIFLTRRKK